jgi:hypothetical protein
MRRISYYLTGDQGKEERKERRKREKQDYTSRLPLTSARAVTTANTNTVLGQRCDEYRTILQKTKVGKKERKKEWGRSGLYTTRVSEDRRSQYYGLGTPPY